MQDPTSVEKLRRGEAATLKRLFKSDHAKLYPLVFRLTRDQDAANDVIKRAFLQLWEDRQELDALEVLFLRLVGYARGLANEFRAENDVRGIESSARTSAGDAAAERLATLPEREHLLYVLHTVDGYSIRELSKAFDQSEADVRAIIGKAMVMVDETFERGNGSSASPTTQSDVFP